MGSRTSKVKRRNGSELSGSKSKSTNVKSEGRSGDNGGPESSDYVMMPRYIVRWNGQTTRGQVDVSPVDVIDDVRAFIIQDSGFNVRQDDQNNMVVVLVHGNTMQNLTTDPNVIVLSNARNYDHLLTSAFLYVASEEEENNVPYEEEASLGDFNVDTPKGF